MGMDPFTKDLFGWGKGGDDMTTLTKMFSGVDEGALRDALFGQLGNVEMGQDVWKEMFGAAQTEFENTAKMRESAYQRAEDILGGRYDPASSPAYSPMRKAVEGAYGGAKENILASLPSGGTMNESLANLEETRAGNLSDIMSQILTGELQGATSLATGSYPQYMQALTGASQAGAIPGQMMGSILQYLVQRMTAGAQMAGNVSPM